jgi:putative intracellular protease/amidase
MKKSIVFFLAYVAVVLLVGPAFAQDENPADVLKPTFLAPIPGLYVHGWPAFTVSYPKEWAGQPAKPFENFRAAASRQGLPAPPFLTVSVFVWFTPLNEMYQFVLAGMTIGGVGKDFKVLFNRPTRLADGTPGQEAEVEWTFMNGPRLNSFVLAVKKDATWIMVSIHHDQGKTGDDLKRIAYSLKLMPELEKPVQVPYDVKAFLDRASGNLVSRDLGKIMDDYSNNFRNNGLPKASLGTYIQTHPDSPIIQGKGLTSRSTTVTIFEPRGDKAYIDGFFTDKSQEAALPPVTRAMGNLQIIKEKGQWKWYGDQAGMDRPKVLLVASEISDAMEFMVQNEVRPMEQILKQAGYDVVIASVSGVRLGFGSSALTPDLKLDQVDLDDYKGMVLPCMGARYPDGIPKAMVELIRSAFEKGMPIAVQCSGVHVLGQAKILQERNFAAPVGPYATPLDPVPGQKNKGLGVVQDGNLITASSCPLDRIWNREATTADLMAGFIRLLRQ